MQKKRKEKRAKEGFSFVIQHTNKNENEYYQEYCAINIHISSLLNLPRELK